VREENYALAGHCVSTPVLLCSWLHQRLDALPLFSYPFDVAKLPGNAIYFFYEEGEWCGHQAAKPRIVRVGTHRDGNFRSRIAEHFLLDQRKMAFTQDQPAPHERSIFRKHIGRALLNKAQDPYLAVWEIDFTTRKTRDAKRHLRDISKEVAIETEVTQILRQRFSFKFIEVADETKRRGNQGLERALIGTLASCPRCSPSDGWLGSYSPKLQIRESGLWLIQHLGAGPLSPSQMDLISSAAMYGG
jgi:hypothetical protein